MKDNHVHSTVSHDGKSTYLEHVAYAKEHGIDEITFTEHWDYYGDVTTEIKPLQMDRYLKEFGEAKEKSDIKINFGVEIGLQPHIKNVIDDFISKYEFDFIIGSSHITRKKDMAYDKSFFEGKTRFEAYMQYFDEMVENLKIYDNFDTYGHMDYVCRYGGYVEKKIEYDIFHDILDEIMRLLIKKDKAIEINSSGLRYGMGTTHPNFDIIKRYIELGGKLITVGSDAHKAEDLCYGFDYISENLKELGVKEIAFYNNRKLKMIGLKEFLKK